MKSIRLLPIVVSIVVSAIVLFGGLFVYRTVAMQNPINEIVTKSAGVQSAVVEINDKLVNIDLKLDSNANLREIYQNIASKGSSVIGSREIKLNVVQEVSPELERWWSKSLFDVAEAMETKQYAKIPEALQKKSADMPGMKTETEMDSKNVYIHLSLGDKHKYIILPRIPAKLGVMTE